MASPSFKSDVLSGKVCFITGGGTGINFGIAKTLAAHGASIVLMGRRKEVLDKACEHLKSQYNAKTLAVQGDVRSFETAQAVIDQAVKHFGKLDVLINGAAGNFLCPAENLTSNAFRTVIEIDLIGTFNLSRAAFNELRKTKGTIINISATLHYSTTPWQIHASAAKAGVDSVTESLAAEWGDYGIRVNGIAPGPIGDTEGLKKLAPPGAADLITEVIPLGRIGSTQDIANAALFLISDAASFISGHTMVVDGASWLYHPRLLSRETLTEMEQQRRTNTSKSKL
eukprot:TRINITY_DN2785_c0_g1_i2.p1 TRINITY_DN2785_c0_g1~~TRINITY_DN2785_c0_g1_i2.p1  ORF type:complete len:296 (-),score=61.43 TRINITY_DN2785_c0_g1_i2:36-887(-)